MAENTQVTCYYILLAHLNKQGFYLLLDNHIFYFYQLVAVFELSIVYSKLLLLELHFTGSIHRVFFGSLILNWMGLCLRLIQIFFCWLYDPVGVSLSDLINPQIIIMTMSLYLLNLEPVARRI